MQNYNYNNQNMQKVPAERQQLKPLKIANGSVAIFAKLLLFIALFVHYVSIDRTSCAGSCDAFAVFILALPRVALMIAAFAMAILLVVLRKKVFAAVLMGLTIGLIVVEVFVLSLDRHGINDRIPESIRTFVIATSIIGLVLEVVNIVLNIFVLTLTKSSQSDNSNHTPPNDYNNYNNNNYYNQN